ncbi:MAG: hypothetical protein H7293_00870 [Candidatus Saccharibacteria bacterium]|nr:hypothetical protein [Rhodoferax sp.]
MKDWTWNLALGDMARGVVVSNLSAMASVWA